MTERLGPFELGEILGEGGSGLVYAAKLEGRDVAVKVLRPELELDAREVQRFVEEAGRMRRVSHPGLVPVLDVGMLPDGRPYIAMPRLPGRALSERLARGPFPMGTAITLFEGVAAAVAALHEAGLVHRDVKPENVLYLPEEERLVLLDLGIARDADAAASTTTRAGLTRGTPAYMAPERLFGRSATIRTDVYELALLLYVMLVGRLPWDEEDPRGRMSPKRPAELGVDVPRPVVEVLLAALDVDFERRPASVLALLEAVRDASARATEEPEGAPSTLDARPGGGGGGTDEARTERDRPPVVITPPAPGAAPTEVTLAQAPTVAAPARGSPSRHETLPSAQASLDAPSDGASATERSSATQRGRERSKGLLVAGLAIAVAGAIGGALLLDALRAPAPATSASAASPARAQSASPSPIPPDPRADEPAAPDATSESPASSASSSADPAPAAPQPSGAPAPGPSASAAQPGPSPTAKSPAPTSTAPPPPATMPAACAGLIQLMCDPASGATSAECASWTANVGSWQARLPATVVAETCQSALDASRSGLALRRGSP